MKNYLISHASELLEGKAKSSQGDLFSGRKKSLRGLGFRGKNIKSEV